MQHNASSLQTSHGLPPIQVFLADDSALSYPRVAELLRARGMVIVGHADAPESAVAGILATQPDVVVLDVQIGRGTGVQVMRSVMKARPHTPFIILSHHAEPAYRRRYLAEGAACFLDKCSQSHELGDAVAGLAPLRRADPLTRRIAGSPAFSSHLQES